MLRLPINFERSSGEEKRQKSSAPVPFGDGLLFLFAPAVAAGGHRINVSSETILSLKRIKVLKFVQSFDIGRLLLVKSAERFCLRK